jgi:hypothetical protein
MALDQTCSDACGWVAGVVGAIALGSFGTPVKQISKQIQVDPLVLQVRALTLLNNDSIK